LSTAEGWKPNHDINENDSDDDNDDDGYVVDINHIIYN